MCSSCISFQERLKRSGLKYADLEAKYRFLEGLKDENWPFDTKEAAREGIIRKYVRPTWGGGGGGGRKDIFGFVFQLLMSFVLASRQMNEKSTAV